MASNTQKIKVLSKALGKGVLSSNGRDVSFRCPKCSKPRSAKKKLSVSLEKGIYHCWVCGLKGGSVHSLFSKYAPGHLDELSTLGKWAKKRKKEKIDRKEIIKPPKGFKLLADSSKSMDPDVNAAISYCYARGLTERDLWYFKLGTSAQGTFRRRVIFPSFDSSGVLNYYAGRAIDDDNKIKYINAKTAKKKVIFNDINIDWSKELVLVEGPFDLTKSTYNSTCLLGSHLPQDGALFQKIVKKMTPVILALDKDAIQKTHNIAKSLSYYGVDVKIVSMPDNRDAGDMTRAEFKQLVSNSKPWSPDSRLKVIISNIKTGSIL